MSVFPQCIFFTLNFLCVEAEHVSSVKNGGGAHLHSCVVIFKQGPTDPTLNTDIFNVKLRPLITDRPPIY